MLFMSQLSLSPAMEEIGYLMVQIFLLLFLAESLGMLLKKAKIPEMVGYILAGIIFINLTIFVPLSAV